MAAPPNPGPSAIAIAARYPLVGTGLNTYGVATLFYQRYDLEQHYAQAHNDYLQLLAEGGLLVLIPSLVVVSLVIGGIRRRLTTDADQPLTWWIRIGAIAGLAGIATQSVVEFSLQMPGNTALFVLLLALAMHRPRSASRRSSSSARVRPFSTHGLAHRI